MRSPKASRLRDIGLLRMYGLSSLDEHPAILGSGKGGRVCPGETSVMHRTAARTQSVVLAGFLALALAGCQTFDTVFAPLDAPAFAPSAVPAIEGPVALAPEVTAPGTTATVQDPG